MTRTNRLWSMLALLLGLMALGTAAHAADGEADGRGPFVDVDGSVHEADVAALWNAGITSGCSEWRFCPDEPVDRGEMAAFLARALDLPRRDGRTFSDTAGSPFAADIEAIAAAGITRGCGEGRYCPDMAVTRAQMASFLARALDLPDGTADGFVDIAVSVHTEDIERLAAAGITRGCGDGRYCPTRLVTRAEMATFLARALELEAPAVLPAIPEHVIDDHAAPAWPTGPGAEGWRPLVELFFQADDVDRAVRIMSCESRGDADARNPRSGASGLFQHMPRYWGSRSAAAGYAGASIFDPEANVAVAAWLVYDYDHGGWHHWVCRG